MDPKGTIVPVKLNFASQGKNDGNSSYLTYLVQNDSPLPVFVLVNLTATKYLVDKVPMIQNKLQLEPGDKQLFNVQLEGAAVAKPGLIVVYNLSGHIGAIDSAAFYTVPGEKQRPDSSFWELLK